MKHILIETDSYTGNFERQLTAWLTGIVGEEDDSGIELVDEEVKSLFEEFIRQESDSDRVYRPCSVDSSNPNNMVIYLEDDLPENLQQLLWERADSFNENFLKKDPWYSEYPKNYKPIKILSISIIKLATSEIKWEIKRKG